MQMKSMAAVALATSGLITSIAAGDAVQWRVADGGNGHWYQRETTSLSWSAARAHSQAHGGDLASLETAGEWQWVSAHVSGNFYLVGGYQRADATSVSEGWTWLTGLPLAGFQTNFDDNPCGAGSAAEDHQQDYVEMVGAVIGDINSGLVAGCTDDGARPFLIEWSADCNNDGIVDYGQCRDGSLPDFNGNNIPDCCEQGTACVVGNYPVQWRSEDGGNGHWYAKAIGTSPKTWVDSRNAATARGADLVAISTAAENAWIVTHFDLSHDPCSGYRGWFIGAYQDLLASDYSEPSGGWRWSNGEPWGWTNWRPGAPDNYLGNQHWALIDTPAEGQAWDDLSAGPDGSEPLCRALIEWSADCNNDGLVDYGQILRGELADTNANGVPDTCESTLLVPSQYPTIQAAIDAVPANSQRTVQVAAGTYHESFALNGKNVLVRGAANDATILDGTGLTTSIAKFTGGEPATAGVESLVFRNGTAGSRFTPKSAFTVGGAIFANNTAAHITGCRFENCRADYGGAVYQLYGGLAWDNCVFTGNTANAEGGAALTYNCTGSVHGCSFTANRCGVIGPGSGSAFKAVGSNGEGETVLLDTCTMSGNVANVSGAAVEFYENTKFHPGVLRIVNTTITGNTSGQPVQHDAAGLRVLGRMQSCVLATGTNICNNTPKNVDGPYVIDGSVTVCGCAADITGDGLVNGGDLGVVLSAWGATSPTGVGDVTHDGFVDGSDLAILLSNWGVCP